MAVACSGGGGDGGAGTGTASGSTSGTSAASTTRGTTAATGTGTTAATGTQGTTATTDATGTAATGTAGSTGTAGTAGTGGVQDPFGCQGQPWVARVILPNQTSATFPTLADAFAAAPNDSTIEVCPGVFVLNDVVLNQRWTILGSGQGVTIFDGDESGRIFNIQAETTIEDVTFTGGWSSNGGAIRLVHALTLRNVTFDSNFSTSLGGAIWAEHGQAGQRLVGEGLTFVNNTSDNVGGALYLRGKMTLVDTVFTNNHAAVRGGAIYASSYATWDDDPTDRTMSQVTLHQNSAGIAGGALALLDGGAVECTGCNLGFGPADDNTPDDVFASATGSASDYFDGIDFTCITVTDGKVSCPDL